MRGNCNLLGNSPSTMLLPISLRTTRTVQWPAGAADPQPLSPIGELRRPCRSDVGVSAPSVPAATAERGCVLAQAPAAGKVLRVCPESSGRIAEFSELEVC